jgi:hypothetical protein
VYRDEPILIPAQQLERLTLPKIRDMRKIARGDKIDEKVFYEQGKFMEAFEDAYDYQGEFAQYFPTYQHMTDAQLRGYFSWRAKIRNGVFEKTSLSFAFVYIYELLNQIGVGSALEGYHTLRDFWTAYRDTDARINSYVEIWLKDYVIYNNLDKALLDGLPDIAFDQAVEVLLDHRAHGAAEVFSALDALSSYKLGNSRFFRQHPDEVMEVVRRVFSVVSDFHNRNPEKGTREKLFGRVCTSAYAMFKSAVFYRRTVHPDAVYEIGDCHTYLCRNGNWSCERFLWYGNHNKRIGALLKTVDYLMRREYGFGSTLQIGKTNKIIRGKIEKEIAKYREEKRRATRSRIDIDLSRLQDIRDTALATRDRLLVEEAEDQRPVETAAAVPEAPARAAALSADEREFLLCLLDGRPYDSLVRSRGLMPSVLIDSINEKLFDAFNDTIIVDEDGKPTLVGDYAEDLKGMIA